MSKSTRLQIISTRLREAREWMAQSMAVVPHLSNPKVGDAALLDALPRTRLGEGSPIRKLEVLIPHVARPNPQVFVQQVLAHWLRDMGDHYGGRILPTNSESGSSAGIFRPLDNGHLGGIVLEPRIDGNVMVLEIKYLAYQPVVKDMTIQEALVTENTDSIVAAWRRAARRQHDPNDDLGGGCGCLIGCVVVGYVAGWLLGDNVAAWLGFAVWGIAGATCMLVIYTFFFRDTIGQIAGSLLDTAVSKQLSPALRIPDSHMELEDHKNLLERGLMVLDEIIHEVRTAYESA
jgi:hypothetical protein